MLMDKIAGSHDDEYCTPEYAIIPILKYIKPNSIIWCPFDTPQSMYVSVFSKHGHKVICSHINDGINFLSCDVPKCDYIISNPPYSIKEKVIQRAFDIDKPFAMLVSVAGLFESKSRFEMFKTNDFEIMYFNKRISYFKDYKNQKTLSNPPFSSVYICHNFLPYPIMFENI